MKKRIHRKLGKITVKNRTVSNQPSRRMGGLEKESAKYILSSKRGMMGKTTNPNPGQHTVNFRKKHCDTSYKTVEDTKVVIFCHFYYNDLIGEILSYIDNLICKEKTLWVSLPCHNPSRPDAASVRKKNTILERFSDANIVFVPNRGKDIGGKLVCLQKYLEESKPGKNEWMIFCHDKKSPHVPEEHGRAWRRDLLSSIFNKDKVYRALCHCQTNAEVQMWGGRVREGIVNSRAIAVNLGNTAFMYGLSRNLGMRNLPFTGAFIGGTMFWVKDSFFRQKFSRINLQAIIKKLERGDVQEPSYTHAVERLFGLLVTNDGYKIGII